MLPVLITVTSAVGVVLRTAATPTSLVTAPLISVSPAGSTLVIAASYTQAGQAR